MSKENLEHIGLVADALHNLLDLAKSQQRNVQDQQSSVAAAIHQMQITTNSVQETAKSLKGELAKEVRGALTDASTDAARLIAQEFVDANRLAAEAATKYQLAVKWSAWRVFALSAFMFALLAGAVVFVLMRSIPSHEEITQLRTEKAMLEKNIHVLEKYGARATVASCEESRPCIRVLDKTTGKDYWAIIYGY